MYTHCIYCRTDLGVNTVVEVFPVGRRLAFDEVRGRLWVICRRCARWNLSPAEERWEAIEECERQFRRARRRLSTDHIGLGVLAEGLELVRVGAPQRPEMAAWRYGRLLLERRRRSRIVNAVSWLALLGPTSMALPLLAGYGYVRSRQVIAHATAEDGMRVPVTRGGAAETRLIASGADGWRLMVPTGRKRLVTVSGAEAVRVAGLVLPTVNVGGAGREFVERAVMELERAGGSEEYFRLAAERLKQRHTLLRGPDPVLRRAPAELRLAVEMAAHEETERRALEGELRELEAAWREAEEIAAIADDLLLPRVVTDMLDRMRGGI